MARFFNWLRQVLWQIFANGMFLTCPTWWTAEEPCGNCPWIEKCKVKHE